MRAYICCLLLVCVSSSAHGQVVEAERGKVEFLGLRHWSVNDLVDTLKAIDPDRSLHACAAVLTGHFGFPDAAVIAYSGEEGLYTVVTVIEPADSARVRYRSVPGTNLPDVDAWQEGLRLVRDERKAVHIGTQWYGYVHAGKLDSARAKAQGMSEYASPDVVEALWQFLQENDDERSKELALWTLANDGNEDNRVVAAALLANFPESDLTWWSLVDALRDPSAQMRAVAQGVLHTLSKHTPRQVDWQPAVLNIRHVLAGTNLFAFTSMLDLLERTSVSPELAAPLLKDNTVLLAAYVGAENDRTRESAEQFLARISGRQFDTTEQWKRWLKNL